MALTSTSEVFDLGVLLRERSIWRFGLDGIPEEPNGQDLVSEYRERIEVALHALDKGMTTLLASTNGFLLELWAARMKTCRNMTDVLDKNLAFKGERPWSWREVLDAMAMLEAVRTLSRTALLNEGIEDC